MYDVLNFFVKGGYFFYFVDIKGDMLKNENIIRKIKELDNVMKLGNRRNIVDCVNVFLEIENV